MPNSAKFYQRELDFVVKIQPRTDAEHAECMVHINLESHHKVQTILSIKMVMKQKGLGWKEVT